MSTPPTDWRTFLDVIPGLADNLSFDFLRDLIGEVIEHHPNAAPIIYGHAAALLEDAAYRDWRNDPYYSDRIDR